jgi:hypothetical protein
MNLFPNLKSLCLGLCVLCLALNCSATHNRGGHITYKRVAPFTKIVGTETVQAYNYVISVIRYHNVGTNVAERCADTVYFGDGGKGVAYRVNGSTCSACGSTISCGVSLSPPLGGKVSTYTVQHTYAGSGVYLIQSFDPNRSPDITNIPNSINHPSYIESQLTISAQTNDNSLEFQDPDVAIAHPNQCWHHTPVITEADGDSLSYEITATRGVGGAAAPGYFFPTGTYGFNGGWLQWCSPQQVGIYAITYIVKEWRKNNNGTYVMMGYVLRDMEVTVLPVTGMGEHAQPLAIGPNPSRDVVSISNPGNAAMSITLLGLTGQVLYSARSVTDHTIQVGQLQPGIYFLKIEHGGYQTIRKIIRAE